MDFLPKGTEQNDKKKKKLKQMAGVYVFGKACSTCPAAVSKQNKLVNAG